MEANTKITTAYVVTCLSDMLYNEFEDHGDILSFLIPLAAKYELQKTKIHHSHILDLTNLNFFYFWRT